MHQPIDVPVCLICGAAYPPGQPHLSQSVCLEVSQKTNVTLGSLIAALSSENGKLRKEKGMMTNLAWLLLDRLAGGSFTFSLLEKKQPPPGAGIDVSENENGLMTYKAKYPATSQN